MTLISISKPVKIMSFERLRIISRTSTTDIVYRFMTKQMCFIWYMEPPCWRGYLSNLELRTSTLMYNIFDKWSSYFLAMEKLSLQGEKKRSWIALCCLWTCYIQHCLMHLGHIWHWVLLWGINFYNLSDSLMLPLSFNMWIQTGLFWRQFHWQRQW